MLTRGSTQDISLRHLLHENGLKATDEGGTVTVLPIDPANMPAAFASSQVDAALVQEPWGAVMESQGAKLIAGEKAIGNGGDYTTTVLVVSTDYAKKNPDAIKALLRGHLAAISFIKSSNAGAQKAISDEIYSFTGKRPSSADLFKGWPAPASPLISTSRRWPSTRANMEAGFARAVPDLGKLVDLSWVKTLAK